MKKRFLNPFPSGHFPDQNPSPPKIVFFLKWESDVGAYCGNPPSIKKNKLFFSLTPNQLETNIIHAKDHREWFVNTGSQPLDFEVRLKESCVTVVDFSLTSGLK